MKTFKKQGLYLLLIVCTLVSVKYVPFGEDDFPRVFSVSEVGSEFSAESDGN
ncbi:MAG: hypothetical protein ACLKAK_04760 [Alkaliphilus sp.]